MNCPAFSSKNLLPFYSFVSESIPLLKKEKKPYKFETVPLTFHSAFIARFISLAGWRLIKDTGTLA
jgi:hypothetical protein